MLPHQRSYSTKPINKNKSHNVCDKSHMAAADDDYEIISVAENRRGFLGKASTLLLTNMLAIAKPSVGNAAGEIPEQFNVDDYLKTGMVMNPMGVSGQAGKSKPVTGM